MTAILLSTIAVLCVVCGVLLHNLRKASEDNDRILIIRHYYQLDNERLISNLEKINDQSPSEYRIRLGKDKVSVVAAYVDGQGIIAYAVIKTYGSPDMRINRYDAEELCALLNAK